MNDGMAFRQSSLISSVDPANMSSTPYLTGSIRTESGEPLKINVLGLYEAKAKEMLYSKSSKTGFFELDFSDFTGKKSLHVNPYLFNEADALSVELKDNTGTLSTQGITLDSTIIKYMESSRARKKIYQQFGKIESLMDTPEPKVKSRKLNPNRRFTISDYQSFENVAAFFNEILASELSFTLDEDDTLRARMYNPKNNRNKVRSESSYFGQDPIFIIDDKITQDADKIGRLPLDNILTVDLYYKVEDIQEDFGTFGGSAYAIVTTSYPNFLLDENEEEDIVTVHGYLPAVSNYEITNDLVSQSEPIFRSTVYYNPTVNTSDGTISFNHGDDISDYEVIVLGQDATGQPVMGKTSYKVRY